MFPHTFTLIAPGVCPLATRRYAPQGVRRGLTCFAPLWLLPGKVHFPFPQYFGNRRVGVVSLDFGGWGGWVVGVRGTNADILTWARQDASAALAAAQSLAPGLPVMWFGHSLGGQIIPYVEGNEAITRAFVIAAGSGYYVTMRRRFVGWC